MGKKKIVFIETKELGKDKTLAMVVEKYYNLDKKVLILTSSMERGEFLDQYLWTFKQLSFVPHVFIKERDSYFNDEPIVITLFEDNVINAEILILDRVASHDFKSKFSLIIDFVDRTSNLTLEDSRKRYKEYKNDYKFEVKYN